MSELEAHTNLIIMVCLVLLMPFVFRVCYALGKLIIDKHFNQKFINIEVKHKSEND